MTKTNAPRVLDDWRKALDVRPENALILAPVTCQDARAILGYTAALEAEIARLTALIDAESDDESAISWTDEYTERFGE